MAEKGFILSAEEELKLREPIDEYIGKIQNIDTQIRKIVNKMDKKEIIFADKFPLLYFAKEYGFKI